MNKTQAGRLLTLAHYLKGVKPDRFDLTCFFDREEQAKGKPLTESLQDPKCGTTACALGYATVLWPKTFYFFTDEFGDISFCHRPSSGDVRVGWYNSKATAEFFGITVEEVDWLFSSTGKDGYEITRTPKQEAREIEKIVEKYGYTYAD